MLEAPPDILPPGQFPPPNISPTDNPLDINSPLISRLGQLSVTAMGYFFASKIA